MIDYKRKEVGKGNLVGTLFLNLRFPFDIVSHDTLLTKLSAYGINNNELDWFKSYLFHRTQQIEIDDISDEKPLFSGVP